MLYFIQYDTLYDYKVISKDPDKITPRSLSSINNMQTLYNISQISLGLHVYTLTKYLQKKMNGLS